jgi:hypothetical protein
MGGGKEGEQKWEGDVERDDSGNEHHATYCEVTRLIITSPCGISEVNATPQSSSPSGLRLNRAINDRLQTRAAKFS